MRQDGREQASSKTVLSDSKVLRINIRVLNSHGLCAAVLQLYNAPVSTAEQNKKKVNRVVS